MSNYQNKIKKQYEGKGYYVTSVVKLGDSGFPDLICLKDGDTVWIECKEVKDTLKPLQMYRIRQLRKMGFEAFATQDTKGKIY